MKKRIFAFVMAVLMASMLLGTAAFAEGEVAIEGTNLLWKVNGTTLEISGTGAMKEYNSYEEAPWKDATITAVTIGAGVTSLGKNNIPESCTAATVPCSLASALPETVTTKTLTHNLKEVPRVEPTYTDEGTEHHWSCTSCSACFSDAAGTQPIDSNSVRIAKLADTEAPVFAGIACNPTSIILTAATTVNVTVNASDALSGVKEGSIIFRNLAKNVSIPVAPLTLSGGVLNGTLNFSSTMPSGQYYINSLTLTDNAGNTRAYSYTELSNQYPAYSSYCITVSRPVPIATVATLSLNAQSMGYGGAVTGTVVLTDSVGNRIPGVTFDVYAGTTKTGIVATTDETGTAKFTYPQSVPGTYALKVVFTGNTDYYGCESNTVNLTVTNNPATGDSYHLMLWVFVAALAIAGNIWFLRRQRMA